MQSPTILALSPELLDMIVAFGDYASAVALSWTCRSLHARITTRNQPYTMADLLEIEMWPCYNGAGQPGEEMKQALFGRDYFACHLCLRIRATDKFSNAMMRGKRGKHCYSPIGKLSRRKTRFCTDCGIRTGKCIQGMTFGYSGAIFGFGPTSGSYRLV